MGKRVYSEDIGQLPIRGTIVECYLPPRESIVCNNCDKKSVTAFEITGRADVSNAFADLRVALCGECADELMDILGHRGDLLHWPSGEPVTMEERGEKKQIPMTKEDALAFLRSPAGINVIGVRTKKGRWYRWEKDDGRDHTGYLRSGDVIAPVWGSVLEETGPMPGPLDCAPMYGSVSSKCPDCDGFGEIRHEPCDRCSGTGDLNFAPHGDKPQDPANGSDKRRTEMAKNTECVVMTAHPLMSSKDLNDLGKMLSAGYTISANETVMVSEDLTLVILRKDDTQGTTGGAS